MANESTGATVWPLPKFYFSVDFGDDSGAVSLQEVSGLDSEALPIEYRAGNSAVFSAIKMPGLRKYGNVTLKRGVFQKGNQFWAWYSEVKMNTIERRNVTIALLDETGKPAMIWTLANAWPTKISGTDLKSDVNEVVVETIELAHEGLSVANG